jgi:hypothetical protein
MQGPGALAPFPFLFPFPQPDPVTQVSGLYPDDRYQMSVFVT